ncbi:hypothetical protein [Henriciella sp.]|uniref:hypothetical protein n=1 Tax=Henriciella sp. TaxID=1968823 RepID=UPI002603210F|nr:hypothetical protein [Henriciella sp.]
MFLILLLIGLVVFVIWGLLNMPSRQAKEIFEAEGPSPDGVCDRDRAYVLDLHRQFGTGDFFLKSIKERTLDPTIAAQFGIQPSRLDDTTELGVRLPHLNLLVSYEPGRYRLTDDAARLAGELAASHQSQETRHHG